MSVSKKELVKVLSQYHDKKDLKKLSKKDLENLVIYTYEHNKKGGSILSNIKNRLSGFFGEGLRKDFSPDIRQFLKQYGDSEIISLTACRDAIKPAFESVINVISLGQYEKNKKALNYDLIFHLYLLAKIRKNGTIVNIRIEKNQTIEIGRYDKSCAEYMPIDIKMKETLNEFLNNGINNTTKDDFFLYNAESRNCQDFILNLLEANKKYINLTSELKSFVKQNTKGILGSLAEKVGLSLTDFAHKLDILIKGRGRKKRKINY